jgi:hypothetical protein
LRILSLLLVVLTIQLYGQFTDDFSDGDFTSTPTWTGNDSKFVINSGLLRLQAPALAETAYLSTSSNAIHEGSWEFYVQMDFNPSNANLVRVDLTSDQADLTQPLNGYFVMIGNTEDEISLYKQSGTTMTRIISGPGRVNLSTVSTKIKVTRDATGGWELFSDVGSTGSYTLEGIPTTDVTHTVSNYFGVYCLYTSTRSTLFWFDNFVVTGSVVPDLSPPLVTGVEILDQSTLKISFNEVIESLSAQTNSNYSINNGIGFPSTVQLQADSKSVILSLPASLTNGLNYSIEISGVEDSGGNVTTLSTNNFLYFVPQPINKKDIIVSEFMADQTPVVGLPEAEFVELLNRSPHPVNLLGWKLTDGALIATLPNYILLPGSSCVVTSSANASQFPGSIGVSNFPSLNNTGDDIIIRNNLGATIDSIHYSTVWYHSDEKKDGGWSLEIIDPENLCGEENNWTASTNILGGTPGAINSVNGNNPDVTSPKIISTQVKGSNSIEIVFDERMDNGNLSAMGDPALDFTSIYYLPSLRSALLVSSTSFQKSIAYGIILNNTKDCSGNALGINAFQFVLPEPAVPGGRCYRLHYNRRRGH